ncbi:MAG TPA: hypothetical protein VMB18_13420 [Terriglobales bacterium]|nr:hypothetical protein [Terriglobales bacterium]
MTPSSQLNELHNEWQNARQLYPLYAAVAREFVIETPSCTDLETGVEAPPEESIVQARQWFCDVDQKIQVHQLRQFLQTTTLASDEALRLLLLHHLHKEQHSGSDRDKIDFLLVQYFSHAAPSRLEDSDVDMAYVAQTLEPVLGSVDRDLPAWLKPLDELIGEANGCKSLNELLTSHILEKGRELKASTNENYFLPTAMVAFARFSFLMRRVFFRLMHQDLNSILDGLRELETRGVSTLDCRRAQFSADEPISRLRMICQSWRVMFHAEYSSGQPLRMLVDLRASVEAALSRTGQIAEASPRAAAAAAGAGSVASAEVPEFEVSAHTPGWSESGVESDNNQK